MTAGNPFMIFICQNYVLSEGKNPESAGVVIMAWLVFPLVFDPYIKRGLITITVLITSSLGLFPQVRVI